MTETTYLGDSLRDFEDSVEEANQVLPHEGVGDKVASEGLLTFPVII